MEVIAYICGLLEHQREVCVPGLGNFYRERVLAYFDERINTFYPPAMRLCFHETKEDVDDSTLATYISSERGISLSSAQYFVKQFAHAVLERIDKGELHVVESFIASKKPTYDLAYDADKRYYLNKQFFGLPPVKVDKLPTATPTQSNAVGTQKIQEQITAASAHTDKIPQVSEQTAARSFVEKLIALKPPDTATAASATHHATPVTTTHSTLMEQHRMKKTKRQQATSSLWLQGLLLLIIIALLIAALYQYDPLLVERLLQKITSFVIATYAKGLAAYQQFKRAP